MPRGRKRDSREGRADGEAHDTRETECRPREKSAGRDGCSRPIEKRTAGRQVRIISAGTGSAYVRHFDRHALYLGQAHGIQRRR